MNFAMGIGSDSRHVHQRPGWFTALPRKVDQSSLGSELRLTIRTAAAQQAITAEFRCPGIFKRQMTPYYKLRSRLPEDALDRASRPKQVISMPNFESR